MSFSLLRQATENTKNYLWAVLRIRIRIEIVSWIRIRIPSADPDPAVDKISSKSQNNSDHLQLFD